MVSKVELNGAHYGKVRSIKFGEGSIIELRKVKELPVGIDFSKCFSVTLDEIQDLPGDLDLSMCGNVSIRDAKPLPEILDFSKCCTTVNLDECNFSNVKEIKFMDGSEVRLCNIKVFPEHLDVSMCSKVDLVGCKIPKGKKIKFRKDSEVTLDCTTILTDKVDFSKCSSVSMKGCDLSAVKELKFKNKEQASKFLAGAKFIRGKIIYTDDARNKTQQIIKSKDMDR